MRFSGQLVPLLFLFPIGEQTNPGALLAKDAATVDFAHKGELGQMLWFAVNVPTNVQNQSLVIKVGDDRRYCRAVNPTDAFKHKHPGRHSGAGIARTDNSTGLTVFNQVESDTYGRVFFLPDGIGRRVAHPDNFTGVLNTNIQPLDGMLA
jgi:hypothetical protein